MTRRIVVVGGGQAAISFAAKARTLDADASIVMLGEEMTAPYQRPPLSKAYLSGDLPLDRLLLRDHDWYEQNRIAWRGGIRVVAIDRQTASIRTAGGEQIGYDTLVLATGSRANRLPASIGGDLPGVLSMRTIEDADALASRIAAGRRMLVVGGGYIGLEAAAVARKHGVEVVLLEAAQRILGRVACSQTADYYRTLHRSHGVDVREDTALSRLEASADGIAAVLGDGTTLDIDLVVVGIGIRPNAELAEAAGLKTGDGILVDEHARTTDPAILAIGDCARFPHRGSTARLESVPHAIQQAEAAAQSLLGDPAPYEAKPWFWSDQYDVKLQIAGLNQGYDRTVVREGRREGSQSVWYYAHDALLAVDAMNDAPAFMAARKIIEAGRSVPPHAAADPASNLRDYV